jgi:hypothetical protein
VLNSVLAVREAAQVSLNSFFGLLLDNTRVSHHVVTCRHYMSPAVTSMTRPPSMTRLTNPPLNADVWGGGALKVPPVHV